MFHRGVRTEWVFPYLCVKFDAKNFASISLSCSWFGSQCCFISYVRGCEEWVQPTNQSRFRKRYLFKKIGHLVFRHNAMLPYKSNRTGKICHDGILEKQNFNDTILKCLCVLSACHLRSAFVQSTDCSCLCQVLFSKTERLNLLNTKDIYLKKVFPPHGTDRLRTFKIRRKKKKNWNTLEL